MALKRQHVLAAVGCAVYLVAIVALMWAAGEEETSGWLWPVLVAWLIGSVLIGREFGVPALWLPIIALPIGVLSANTWADYENEMRVVNWAFIFVVSLALVSAGVWAWLRRQPR